MEVQSLIEKTMPTDGSCAVEEYLNGDNDLSVCRELDSDKWEADFLEGLGQEEEEEVGDEEEDEREEEMDVEPPPPKLKSFREAIECLEDVQQFLESKGCIEHSLGIGSTIDTMTALKVKSLQQTSLHDYNYGVIDYIHSLC